MGHIPTHLIVFFHGIKKKTKLCTYSPVLYIVTFDILFEDVVGGVCVCGGGTTTTIDTVFIEHSTTTVVVTIWMIFNSQPPPLTLSLSLSALLRGRADGTFSLQLVNYFKTHGRSYKKRSNSRVSSRARLDYFPVAQQLVRVCARAGGRGRLSHKEPRDAGGGPLPCHWCYR